MHFSIRYLTEYRYSAPVADNLNALRVTPATNASQRVDDFGIRIDPEARIHRHDDYYGTEVIEFGVVKPHDRLSIDVRARVVTADPPAPPEASWSAIEAVSYRAAAGEYLLPWVEAPENGAMEEMTRHSRANSPYATLRLLSELIPDRFEYRPGVTYVGSTVADLLDAGAGVCQDFVHITLVLLRRLGIAARYTSGYFWAADPDGGDDSLEVQTHAWLEALLPPAGGSGEPVWVGVDPTNRRLVDASYVKIGHGRSYADVPPIKGVFRGTADADLDARVTMTRLDTAAAARP